MIISLIKNRKAMDRLPVSNVKLLFNNNNLCKIFQSYEKKPTEP